MYISNLTFEELRREAEYTNNELALRILDLADNKINAEVEEAKAGKCTVSCEVREYALNDLDVVGDFVATLIKDIRRCKGGVRATKQAGVNFKYRFEDEISVDSAELLAEFADKIYEACL